MYEGLTDSSGQHVIPYTPRTNAGVVFRHRDGSGTADFPDSWHRQPEDRDLMDGTRTGWAVEDGAEEREQTPAPLDGPSRARRIAQTAIQASFTIASKRPAAYDRTARLQAQKGDTRSMSAEGTNRWLQTRSVSGASYDATYDRRAAAGENVHGEADFVERFAPSSVLDGGCGTGRVGRELARRGVSVTGVDIDPEMLATARLKAPEIDWRIGDLATIDLARRFDAVVLAGNVMIFLAPGSESAVVENMLTTPQRGRGIDRGISAHARTTPLSAVQHARGGCRSGAHRALVDLGLRALGGSVRLRRERPSQARCGGGDTVSGYRAPEGIDSARVDAWLAEHVPDVSPPFRYELITGGRSNLTYCATDAAGRKLVVRRPPLGTLLATAHDVVREFRIAAALADTPVPVAPALAVCEDTAVNGTPFAVTGFVEGIVLDSTDKVAPVPEDARRTARVPPDRCTGGAAFGRSRRGRTERPLAARGLH